MSLFEILKDRFNRLWRLNAFPRNDFGVEGQIQRVTLGHLAGRSEAGNLT